MSFIYLDICWAIRLRPTHKSVLIALADHADDRGHCWPSIPTLMKRTCLGRSAVINSIQCLELAGLITIERRSGRGNRYRIAACRSRAQPVVETHHSQIDTGSRREPGQSAKQTSPVLEEHSNHQEPSVTVIKEITARELDLSHWPERPPLEVLVDWLDHRRKKRAPVSFSVLRSIGKELHIAAQKGFSVEECLLKAMNRNWQGFEAAWMKQEAPTRALAISRQRQAIESLLAPDLINADNHDSYSPTRLVSQDR
jgi:hypothetical protein